MKTNVIYAATTVFAVGLGLGGYFAYSQFFGDKFEECRTSVAANSDQIGGAFTLTDHNGLRVSESDVIDGLTLIYFGYSYCPDVCPLDTARNAETVDILEESGIVVKPVMISVDPERDTPEILSEFVGYIHPRMVGLTGSKDEISAVIKQYKVYSAIDAHEEGDEYYLVSHSTNAYLMAPDYGFLQFFTRVDRPEAMAETIACYADKI